jgi:hypothetical protein
MNNPLRADSDPDRVAVALAFVPLWADWLIYAGIAVCAFLNALLGRVRTDADLVPYLDISDAIRAGLVHNVINAYWFPLYPFLLTAARAASGFRPQFELMAARLLDAGIQLLFVFASVAFSESARRLMLARGAKAESLLPRRTLYLWTAIVSYFLASLDLSFIKPDALLSSFMILTVASVVFAVAEGSLLAYAAAGIFAAVAYWTKAFAFPFFLMLLFFTAAANLRDRRILARLALPMLIFGLLAGPYIARISALKGRFTFGDSGRLDLAWYVNGADRFNPVAGPIGWQHGSAQANLKHPGVLLSADPRIAYFGGDQVYGSTPQWDDPSYWSDGLSPRFVPSQTLRTLGVNLKILVNLLPARFQVVLLYGALVLWGFCLRRESYVDSMQIAVLLAALGSIGLYALVVLEGRFVIFAFVLIAALLAASSVSRFSQRSTSSLHLALIVVAGVILLFGYQREMREARDAESAGAQPLHGVYDLAATAAADALASRFPQGSEIACVGDATCWDDPYWVRLGGLKMTALIETGPGHGEESVDEGCRHLAQNAAAIDVLRQHHVRAIVARFEGRLPCSADWQPLERSDTFYILPL